MPLVGCAAADPFTAPSCTVCSECSCPSSWMCPSAGRGKVAGGNCGGPASISVLTQCPDPHFRSLFSPSCFYARSGPVGLNWVHFYLCAPREPIPRNVFSCHNLVGLLVGRRQGAAKHPTVRRTTPTTESDLAAHVNSDRVLKPAVGEPLRLPSFPLNSSEQCSLLPGTARDTPSHGQSYMNRFC